MSGANCPQQKKPLAGQEVAHGLEAGEANFLARSLRDAPAFANHLHRFAKVVHYVAERPYGKAYSLHLISLEFVSPLSAPDQLGLRHRSPSTWYHIPSIHSREKRWASAICTG